MDLLDTLTAKGLRRELPTREEALAGSGSAAESSSTTW
jgi:hypothetical protein